MINIQERYREQDTGFRLRSRLRLRRSPRKNFSTLTSIIIFSFMFLIFSYPLSNAFAEVAGKITKVEGKADILRAGTTAAEPIKVGDSVSIGDIVRTKSDGKVELTLIDSTVMTLGPKSRLGIDEYLFKPDENKREVSLKLYRGKTGFKVPKPVYSAEGSKFEMKTRTAVAGVRGTAGDLHSDGIERVYVKDGIVEFRNIHGSAIITAGEVGEIIHGGIPSVRPYTEIELKKRIERTVPVAHIPIRETTTTDTLLLTTTTTTTETNLTTIPVTDVVPTETKVNVNVIFP